MDDALAVAKKFNIAHRTFDLTPVREAVLNMMGDEVTLNNNALVNLPPRLRMTTLYTVAAAENRLVAGTGNRSERYMGYFTKHGDGACDFNPISDLTVTEVYEFLRFLDAPASVIEKAPSAGLYEGQTDEKDMGIS
jgi:NAD+ synthase